MRGLPAPVSNLGEYQVNVTQYKGMNYRAAPVDGELVAAQNISSRNFPYLSNRLGRTTVGDYENPTGCFAWDRLVVIDGNKLYYDGEYLTDVLRGEKQFAVIDLDLVVWPDKIIINLQTKEVTQMVVEQQAIGQATFTKTSIQLDAVPKIRTDEAEYTMDSSRVAIKVYDSITVEGGSLKKTGGKVVAIEDKAATMGKYFVPKKEGADYVPNTVETEGDSLGTPDDAMENGDKVYCRMEEVLGNTVENTPETGNTGTLRFSYAVFDGAAENKKWASKFAAGQAVNVTGCTKAGNNKRHIVIQEIDEGNNKLVFAAGTFSDGDKESWEDGPITVTRDIPDLDFICEKDNRIWGVSNKEEGEIYNATTQQYEKITSRVIMASALGNPLAWWDFSGVDTDAYQVAVATKGNFTALVAYGDAVLAMKEYSIHKIWGDYPSNYQMTRDDIQGVAQGCSKSAVIINEVLYYVGPDGVYGYTGTVGQLMSYTLGDVPLTAAAGGTDGVRYYLAANRENIRKLWVYDTRLGVWMEEDETQVQQMSMVDGVLYGADGKAVQKMADEESDETVEWMAELAPSDEGTLKRKRYKWLRGRVTLEKGAMCRVWYAADGQEYQLGKELTAEGLQTFQVPLAPMRTDKIRVKVEGSGDIRLDAMERAFYVGTEME